MNLSWKHNAGKGGCWSSVGEREAWRESSRTPGSWPLSVCCLHSSSNDSLWLKSNHLPEEVKMKKNKNLVLLTSGNTGHCWKSGVGKGKVLLAPMFCSTKIFPLDQGGASRDCARPDLRHFLLILPLCTWIEAGTSSHCTTLYYSHKYQEAQLNPKSWGFSKVQTQHVL